MGWNALSGDEMSVRKSQRWMGNAKGIHRPFPHLLLQFFHRPTSQTKQHHSSQQSPHSHSVNSIYVFTRLGPRAAGRRRQLLQMAHISHPNFPSHQMSSPPSPGRLWALGPFSHRTAKTYPHSIMCIPFPCLLVGFQSGLGVSEQNASAAFP
jgi:hypothetical protein